MAGLCLLTFAPSYELTKSEFVKANNLELPTAVDPGRLIVLPKNKDYPEFTINGVPFTEVKGKSLQYAVASVYGGSIKVLSAVIPEPMTFLAGVLYAPLQKVLRHKIQVDNVPLNSGNELRLPASVRDRLDSAEVRKKQQDRDNLVSALSGDAYGASFDCIKRPVNSKITSQFGRPRTLPSGRSYYHSGVDLRARTGTPIFSALDGKVVYAGHMTVSGNNVVLSHGGGLYSRYLHLSKIKVKEGQRLPAAEIVGLAGATGRVEAAHLHWEMIWKGQYASPLHLMDDWNQICL